MSKYKSNNSHQILFKESEWISVQPLTKLYFYMGQIKVCPQINCPPKFGENLKILNTKDPNGL